MTREDSKRGRKELQNCQKTINKMAIANPYSSIITLNVNRLNSPNKRHRVWNGQKDKIQQYVDYKRFTLALDTCRPTVKGWENIL